MEIVPLFFVEVTEGYYFPTLDLSDFLNVLVSLFPDLLVAGHQTQKFHHQKLVLNHQIHSFLESFSREWITFLYRQFQLVFIQHWLYLRWGIRKFIVLMICWFINFCKESWWNVFVMAVWNCWKGWKLWLSIVLLHT